MAAPFPSPTKIWHDNTYSSLSPTRPELSASGKSILITGGGSGIGAATAHAFAAAGATRIALLGRRMQPLLDTKASIEAKHGGSDGVKVTVFSVDVTQKHAVDAAFGSFTQDGPIDVLVSNAAIVGPMVPIVEVDYASFMDDAVRIILGGSLLVAQAFLRQHAAAAAAGAGGAAKREDAVIIDVNSSAAHVNFGPGVAAYSVGKMAACRLWDSVACEHPELRVFHVQPGVVDTDMNREAGGVKAMGFEDHVSLPATFMLWLASDEARFLKGKFVWANWDVDELKAQAQAIEAGTRFNVGMVGWPFQEAGGEWKFAPSTSWGA